MILGIIGLGLIGGSFALSCKQYCNFEKIVGIDNNETHTKEALKLNIVDEIIDFKDLTICDVIVIATPINAIIDILQKLSKLELKKMLQ